MVTKATEVNRMDIALKKKNPKSCFNPKSGLVMRTMEVGLTELLTTQPFM